MKHSPTLADACIATALDKKINVDNLPIDRLDLPSRVRRCLQYEDCVIVGDVRKLSDDELRRIPNFGRLSFATWKQCLVALTGNPAEAIRAIPMDTSVWMIDSRRRLRHDPDLCAGSPTRQRAA